MWYIVAIIAIFSLQNSKSEHVNKPNLSDLAKEVYILSAKYSLIQENYEQLQVKYDDIRKDLKEIREKSESQEIQIAYLQNQITSITSQKSKNISYNSAEKMYTKNNNTIEERLSHLEELAKTIVVRTCAELQEYGVHISGTYFIDPDGENVGHAPIRVFCDFDNEATEILHGDDSQMITIPHCKEELCYEKEFIYTAPMDQIVSLIQLSSSCSQNIVFDCYLAPLFYNDVEVGMWTDRYGEDQVYFNGANYGNHMCTCFENDTCFGHEVFNTRCNCDNSGASEWLEDSGTITNSTALPITAFKYGPLYYETQQAKVMVGRLKCSGKSNIKSPPSSCNDLKIFGETRSGLYPFQDSDNHNYTKVSYCNMTLPGYEGNIETMEGWIKFTSGPGDVLFAVQHHGDADIPVGSIITYDTAIVNNGNAMDLSSGIFTVNISGLYQFTFSGMLKWQSGKPDRVDIMVNGIRYIQIYGTGTENETVSKTFVLRMKIGDTVHLVLIDGSLYGEAWYTEFMGKLL